MSVRPQHETSRGVIDVMLVAPPVGDRSTLLDEPLGTVGRPSWRGRLHLLALLSVIPLLAVLAVESDGARARAAVVMYAIGLCTMLAVSTTYHRWVHTIRARGAWRRADHAAIFAAIAGTFAALALISLGTGPAIAALILVWGAAVASAAVKIVWFDRAHQFGSVMYIGLGWAGLAIAPALWQRGGFPTVALVLGGGVIYTVGALAFSRHWPTLRPSTFSYHEFWHACTLVAAGLHLAAIWTVAT